MARRPEPPRGLRASTAWWPLIREVISFLIGSVLLVVETTHDDPRPLVILIGLAMGGYPILSMLDRWLAGK